jgi:hypothetical protein
MENYRIYTRVDGLGGDYCGSGRGWAEGEFATLEEALKELEEKRQIGSAPCLFRDSDGKERMPDGSWI